MTVKAVQFHRFGNIDVLELAEIEPEPLKENQVRVQGSCRRIKSGRL